MAILCTGSATFVCEVIIFVFKQLVVTNPHSSVMKNEPVVVYAQYGDKSVNVTLMTDINGTARFSFDTSDWLELPVELQVRSDFFIIIFFLDYVYAQLQEKVSKLFSISWFSA